MSFGHEQQQQESAQIEALERSGRVAMRYVDGAGAPTERYPLNPNGSKHGITALSSADGRVLALMPHPERGVSAEAMSWKPPGASAQWKGRGPWLRMFESARRWVHANEAGDLKP